MSEKELEVEFQKLNLKEGDCLVIKVNTYGMSEDEAIKKLSSIREDEFIEYVENKGNKVFVTYSGIGVEILRMEETDKLAVYVDTTSLEESKLEKYLEFIEHKLESLGDKVVIIPTQFNSPQLRVIKEEE
nr:MAG: hypothetical protein [Caudoviricetes sp.]